MKIISFGASVERCRAMWQPWGIARRRWHARQFWRPLDAQWQRQAAAAQGMDVARVLVLADGQGAVVAGGALLRRVGSSTAEAARAEGTPPPC